MSDVPRKKSPRAPSLALDEAIDRALKIYDKERRHPAPLDAVAQHLGYKSSTNGAALAVFATLRYYGLVERPKEGMLAVTKEVESYKFAPDEKLRQQHVLKWLKSPALFAELLDDYAEALPSDANIKYALIQRGFSDKAADSALVIFRRSVDFANYYERQASTQGPHVDEEQIHASETKEEDKEAVNRLLTPSSEFARELGIAPPPPTVDRIPVRLGGGRRAWIEIPTPFYAADKSRLKAQIDLLITDDEDE